jgi:hypothetical protein
MEAKETAVKLIAMRYNDYAAATMADHSLFAAEDRRMPSESGANQWIIFTAAKERYIGKDSSIIGAAEDHHAQLYMALGDCSENISPENADACFSQEHYVEMSIDVNKGRELTKKIASIIETEDLKTLFPNAKISIISDFKDLNSAYDKLDKDRLLTRRINTDAQQSFRK